MSYAQEPLNLDLTAAAEFILAKCGRDLRLALPLGLGKPNVLVNRLYERIKIDQARSLRIYTALSLSPPLAKEGLGRAFLDPFRKRHWGEDYPDLSYARDAQRDRLPPNVKVHEFYLQAGSALASTALQRDYRSLNYTHVADSLLTAGVQAVVQLIAKRGDGPSARYSLSCNPDLTLDVIDLFQAEAKPLFLIGVVHPDLPFLEGDAEVDRSLFAVLVEDPATRHELFALPRMPVSAIDHAIGFHASRVIADDGTLQIGIGSLSDAVVSALMMRHRDNGLYRQLGRELDAHGSVPAGVATDEAPFATGLYGLSEMVMDGFMHLREAGILRRQVIDERNGTSAFLHGAFVLGSKPFYEWLRRLPDAERAGLHMSRVSRINDIYDRNETALRAQRKQARFLNTCMQVTMLGGAASDTLPDGKVVSGVGGQYNFVAMAHELRGARSVMMVRSARRVKGKLKSNLVWSHPQLTIPRHLRDVVVTEYGVADLRGKSDEETIKALLQVADAAFQDELADTAKRHGKLARDYRVPDIARHNTNAEVQSFITRGRARGTFQPFPFGSDFTPVEEHLALALEELNAMMALPRAAAAKQACIWAMRSASQPASKHRGALERMGRLHPKSLRERFERALLMAALDAVKR